GCGARHRTKVSKARGSDKRRSRIARSFASVPGVAASAAPWPGRVAGSPWLTPPRPRRSYHALQDGLRRTLTTELSWSGQHRGQTSRRAVAKANGLTAEISVRTKLIQAG